MKLNINEELRELIPPLSTEEKQLLTESILKEGCRDSLITWDNTIIDGHNRYEICTRNNIPFKVQEMDFENIGQVKNWMIKNQLARRNLTDSQRRYFIGKRYEEEKKIQGTNNQYIQSEKGQDVTFQNTAKEIAEENNISDRTVKRNEEYSKAIDKIKEHQPEVAEKILNEEIRISNKDVITLSKHEPEEQKGIIEVVKKDNTSVTQALKEIKKEELKREREEYIQQQKKDIEEGKAKLPEGKFEVINIDPPWAYGTKFDPNGRRVANPYPEMEQEELLNIEIPSTDNSILFLWTTHRFIFDAKELLEYWGFTYRNILVWNKEKIGMGDLFRMQCEFCLVGIKGKPLLDNNHTWRDIFNEARREHSRKPDCFYNMVDELCVGRKLDYFSREVRQGWEVFGNDTSKY